MSTTVIIPARYASKRFPGKPLMELAGRSCILRTLDAAREVMPNAQIYVATDDQRIAEAVEAESGQVVFTGTAARNGTERVAEAALQLGLSDDDIVVNLQGDAPLTPSWFIEAVLTTAAANPHVAMVTPVLARDVESYHRFKNDRAEGRVGATTAVLSNTGRAIYFSKEVIPFLDGPDALSLCPVYHHVGLYAYRVAALHQYRQWGEDGLGPLEEAEGLEQLRFIENNSDILAVIVDHNGQQFWELNNPEDVSIIEQMIDANSDLNGSNDH